MLLPSPTVRAEYGLLIAVIVLAGIAVSAIWVYVDAKAAAKAGRPIVLSAGTFRLETPIAWFFACLLLWEIFFPFYIDSRSLA